MHYEINTPYKKAMLIRSVSIRETKNGKKFLDLTLSDKDGEIKGKLWDASPEQQETLLVGTPVLVEFTTNEFNGQLQANVTSIEPTETASGLVPTAPEDPEDLYQEIMKEVKHFKDDDLKILVTRALVDNHEAFVKCPAAKAVHHAVIGGLAYHTCCMMRSAKALCGVYEKAAEINKDLLIAGVIMHDMAKLQEFNLSPLGLVTEYSVKGNLLGHLYMGAEYIHDLCRELVIPEDKEMLLKHLILSHHGQPEYGAVVRPAILEAQLLHMIDDIDAKTYVYNQELSKLEPGQISEPVFALDRTKLYKY